ncbi:solute carrier family 46 member 3 [Plakobranchus ocellatus]|uniref:Solute carrier family 46 member 3 n=1 Tax=Plakobranchus ocellatus TaxID=259542 RepID=A0AAV3ZJZ3_9GAST|nr:solute carrier family 46 member 3 [Plakobranchus ocellatus]
MLGKYCVLGGCLAEIVFFLYKTGEAMLDAAVRPYIIRAVCEDLTRNNMMLVSTEWTAGHRSFYNASIEACYFLKEMPSLERAVQERSATFLMIYRIVINVPAVFLGLFCGAWSDRTGRKLPMMLPSLGSILAVLLYLLGMVVLDHTLLIIMAGALVQGLLGKSSVITMAVNSYVTDTTFQEDRTRKLGKLLAMNFFGLFFGSLLAGAFQDVSTLHTTLAVVAVFHGASVLTVFLCMEESVHDKMPSEEGFDSNYNNHSLFSFHGMMESIRVLSKPRDGGRRTLVLIAFLAMFLNQTCKVGEQDVTVLFVQKPPLSWHASSYGYLLSVDYATMGLCLLFFLPVLSTFGHLSDISIVLLGLACKLVRTFWAGFCTDTWMVFTSVIIGSMAGIITSALRSILSKSVSDDETGKVFALASSAETAAKLIGSVVFVNIYAATLKLWAGLAYMCCAFVYLFLIVIMVWLYKEVQLMSRHGLTNGLSGVAGYWTFSPRGGDDHISLTDGTSSRSHNKGDNAGRGKHQIMPTILEPDDGESNLSEKEDESLLPLSASSTSLTTVPAAATP